MRVRASLQQLQVSQKAVENFSGYWTGSFEGTNSGGLSFTINQKESALSGFATIHEPAFGISQYTIIGEVGPPTKFELSPMKQIQDLTYGVIQVNCSLVNDEILKGQWQSTSRYCQELWLRVIRQRPFLSSSRIVLPFVPQPDHP